MPRSARLRAAAADATRHDGDAQRKRAPSGTGGAARRATATGAPLREACAGVAAVLSEADDDDAVLALCRARGHAQYIGSIGEAFDEEVGDRATSVALIGGGVVGGAGDEREDGATNEQRQTDNSEAAPSLSVLVGVLPKGSSIEAASFAPDKTPPPKTRRSAGGPARRRAAGMSRLCGPVIAVAGPELRRARRALPRLCGGRRPHLRKPGATTMALGGALLPAGATCVLALSGPRLRVDCVASQGCAPVGDVYEVTRAARSQVVAEIDGRPPAVTLDKVMRGATDRERELLKRGRIRRPAAGRGVAACRAAAPIPKTATRRPRTGSCARSSARSRPCASR